MQTRERTIMYLPSISPYEMYQHLDYSMILSSSQVGRLMDSWTNLSPFLSSNTQHLEYFASLSGSQVGGLVNPFISPFQSPWTRHASKFDAYSLHQPFLFNRL
jgi:hypothetical protein